MKGGNYHRHKTPPQQAAAVRASETCGVAPFLPLFGLMTHTKTSVPSLSGLSAPVPRAALWESPAASGSLACSLQGLEAQAAPVFLEQFLKAEPMLEDSLVQGAGVMTLKGSLDLLIAFLSN